MGPNPVIGLPPALHEHLHFPECIKQLPIQQFLPEFPIKALDIPFLPGASRCTEQCLYPHMVQPLAHSLPRELRSLVRSNMLRYSPLHTRFSQAEQHLIGAEPSRHINGQALTGPFIHDREQFHRTPVFGAGGHEIVRLHMVRMLGQESNGAIRQPEPPARRLFLRNLQAFAPPDSLHALMIDPPAIVPQHAGDLPIAVAPILTGEPDDGRSQRDVIVRRRALIALGGAGLTEHGTHPTFGKAQRHAAVFYGLPSARWA